MTDVMRPTAKGTNNSHLEATFDYKPPPSSTTNLTGMSAPATDVTSSCILEDLKEMGDPHDDEEEENDDDGILLDLYFEEVEWDQGGQSHCGYSEAVHSTLMSVGERVHSLVGDPSPHVGKELKAVGNWFQEASYAARDLIKGDKESSGMQEDVLDAVHTLATGASNAVVVLFQRE